MNDPCTRQVRGAKPPGTGSPSADRTSSYGRGATRRHPVGGGHAGGVRTVRHDEVPDQPWRNGGGRTRELHRDERWRLSVATITAAGPFSTFPGVLRWFAVARGTLALDLDGAPRTVGRDELLVFDGELPVVAHPEGEVLAVNVMATSPPGIAVLGGRYPGGSAVAVVDLDTLQAHFEVARGDLPALERAVVILEASDVAVPRGRSRSRGSVHGLATG